MGKSNNILDIIVSLKKKTGFF